MTDKPNIADNRITHSRFTARLQVVYLDESPYLLLDKVTGVPPVDLAKRFKEGWGVKGVVVVDGGINID